MDLRYLPENKRCVFDPDQWEATLIFMKFTEGHWSHSALDGRRAIFLLAWAP